MLLKDGMGLKLENFNIMYVHWKGGHKYIYIYIYIYIKVKNYKSNLLRIFIFIVANSLTFAQGSSDDIQIYCKTLYEKILELKQYSGNCYES